MDVEKIKKDFPIFKNHPDISYLDSAASSQTPRSVISAMDDYYSKFRSNIHRGLYNLSEEATNSYENARDTVASFLGAEREEIIFTPGSTWSANILALSLEYSKILKKSGDIVTSVMEHHSSLIPIQKLSERIGYELKYITIDGDMRLRYDEAEKLIGPKTALVWVSFVSNVLGTINDLRKITELARKNGALLAVDATSAMGHTPINVKEIGCDFLFFSGHKMLGPTGVGVLYGRRELLEKMEPGVWGGGIVSEVSKEGASWTKSPNRFEPGTPNISGVIGLAEAVRYLKNIGLEKIKEHTEKLVFLALKELETLPGVRIFAEKDPKKNIGIISFVLDDVHPHDVSEILGRHGIAVRGGHHCAEPLMKELGLKATNRASFYLYNEEKDIKALVSGIKEAQKIFS